MFFQLCLTLLVQFGFVLLATWSKRTRYSSSFTCSQIVQPNLQLSSKAFLFRRYWKYKLFQNDTDIILFSMILLSLKDGKKKSPLPSRGHSFHFSLHNTRLSFILFLFTCIIFRELFLPGSPKYVMKWWIILMPRGFVPGKVSPLRGSESMLDIKITSNFTVSWQESRRKVTQTSDFTAHF